MATPAPGFLAFASAAMYGSGIHLRHALPEDLPLLADIYASTRSEELQQTGWSDEQKRAFTDWQSAKQEEHYALHYPRAERLVIGPVDGVVTVDHDAAAVGRIYVDTTASDVRLMDVTLLPQHRNRGIGTRLMSGLLRYAESLGLQVSLHVEPFNPARRMYERMSFAVVETRGLYEFMVRQVSPPEADPAKPGPS